ncbi:MAG TPA: 16S rRNA (guanine(966)-N(2))-methyltransferase RsmD [Gemmatimonadaceae bacterium]|nr:16S rRNA (guanine(966)-N(2))-methyltransferase RsmD [Gemmatimonadaceae bacterium]
MERRSASPGAPRGHPGLTVRIVSGRWRGRTIVPPADPRVRPTADKVREAWMSILQHDLPDARVLDLFAGSGALGLEALSRGAASVEFVEVSARSLAALRRNVETLQAAGQSRVHRGDALRFIERLAARTYDVAFADPPYRLGLASQVAARWLDVPFATVLAVEHDVRESLPDAATHRKYGDTVITIYRDGADDAPPPE